MSPRDPQVIGTLAITLDSIGRKAEAIEAYRETLKYDPKNGAVLNNLAYLLADSGGDLREALECAQRARDVLPNSAEVMDTVGWIYLKSNMTAPAVELFSYLVAKYPDSALFRLHYGMSLAQKGEKGKAVRELQQALKNGPTKDDEAKIRALLEKLR